MFHSRPQMDRTAGSSDVRLMFEENRAGTAVVVTRG